MTTERMSPLRRRMIEDMMVRGHGEKTKLDYIRAIKRFVVVEFPDVESAKQWWASDVYRPAKHLRQETTDTNMILVDGV